MIIGVSYDALWELPGDYAMNVVIRVNDVQEGVKCGGMQAKLDIVKPAKGEDKTLNRYRRYFLKNSASFS